MGGGELSSGVLDEQSHAAVGLHLQSMKCMPGFGVTFLARAVSGGPEEGFAELFGFDDAAQVGQNMSGDTRSQHLDRSGVMGPQRNLTRRSLKSAGASIIGQ